MRKVGPAHLDIPQVGPSEPRPASPTYEGKTACNHSPTIPSPLPVLVGAENGNQVNSFLFNGSLGGEKRHRGWEQHTGVTCWKTSWGWVEKTAVEMKKRQEMG